MGANTKPLQKKRIERLFNAEFGQVDIWFRQKEIKERIWGYQGFALTDGRCWCCFFVRLADPEFFGPFDRTFYITERGYQFRELLKDEQGRLEFEGSD